MKKIILISSLLISIIACKQEQKEGTNEHVKYMSFNDPNANITGIQGIRGVLDSKDVYIAGTFTESSSLVLGLLYVGPLALNGNEGQWHKLKFKFSFVLFR